MSLALSLIFALSPALQSGANEAHKNEWTIRRWALFPKGSQEEVLHALESGDWRQRERALSALARSTKPLAPNVERAAAACLEFDHPSVKAATLKFLAVSVHDVRWNRALGSELATNRLPEVRAALARMLGRNGGDHAVLSKLAFDEDPRVRKDARRALFGEFEPTAGAAALSSIAREGELGELLQALDWTRRRRQTSAPTPALTWRREELSYGRQALMGALDLSPGWGPAESVDAMLNGWFADELDRREARLFLTRVASHLEPELARLSLQLWLDLDRGESERWPTAVEDCRQLGEEAKDRRHELLSTAMDALGPAAVVRHVDSAGASVEARVRLIDLAAFRLSSWESSVARGFLESGEPEVRRAILLALTRDHNSESEVSVTLLLEVLQSGAPDERRLAFEFLCAVRDSKPVLEPLVRAWRSAAEPERRELLRELPRHIALAPFRSDLIELAQRGGKSRDAVFDLLFMFRPDEEIASLSLGWVETELALALDGELGGPSTAERRAAGALRLARRLSVESQADRISKLALRVLQATAERSELISRAAVEILEKSREGRALLPEFLVAPTLEPTRIDVAIALAQHGYVEATEVLQELLPGASLKTAFRIMAALGQSQSAEVLDWLAARALDDSISSELRGSATRQLARWGTSPEVLEQLGRIAMHAPDVVTMADAIRGLAGCGTAGAPTLLRLLHEHEGEGDSRLAELEQDYRALVRIELLNALAEAGELPSELWGEVLKRPMESTAEWFEARLRSAPTAKVEFEWRGELQLFSTMMRDAHAAEVLGSTPEWWHLDGRLLAQLGESEDYAELSSRDVPAVIEMFRAALVALEGELRTDSEYALRVWLDLLRILLAEERWEQAAHVADRIVADWREGRIPERVWSASLGSRSRLREHDAAARLAALGWQLRARQAVEDEDLERARSEAGQAEACVGISREAREIQRVLEGQIEALARRLSNASHDASDD